MAPIQRSVTSWKCRQSRPAGCSMVQAFWSGMLQRPEMRLSSCNSCSSLTALAVGLTGCCALTGGVATTTMNASASAPTTNRTCLRMVAILVLLISPLLVMPALVAGIHDLRVLGS